MSIVLNNSEGAPLECVAVALGWDPSGLEVVVADDGTLSAGIRFDLNVAALLFSGDQLVDAVYYAQLTSQDGSVRHTGDSSTGEGPGDNEMIVVDLVRLAQEVTAVVLVVTSYVGQSFANIDNAYCRVLDLGSGAEITRCVLTGYEHTALVLGKLVRTTASWEFESIGLGVPALHAAEAVPYVLSYLQPTA